LRRRWILVVAVILLGCLLAYDYYSGVQETAGTITVSGAFALYPMMVKWAEEYQKTQANVRIEVSAGGAGKGMTDALSGLVDLGMISREIDPSEVQRGAYYVAVVKDAVVVTVNENNPVLSDLLTQGATESTFFGVYISGNITTWGQVVGRSEIKDPIHVFTRSDSCGAADIWAKYLGHAQPDLKGTGVYGDPGIAEAVKNDRLAIGYDNVNYAYDSGTGKPVKGLAVVPLDVNANGHVDSNENFYGSKDQLVHAIATGAYPSPPARFDYLVTKNKFTGVVKDFVKWILTDGQKYVVQSGYVPLTAEVQQQQLAKLET
jgi:phosphate transport system substrate-binding protein